MLLSSLLAAVLIASCVSAATQESKLTLLKSNNQSSNASEQYGAFMTELEQIPKLHNQIFEYNGTSKKPGAILAQNLIKGEKYFTGNTDLNKDEYRSPFAIWREISSDSLIFNSSSQILTKHVYLTDEFDAKDIESEKNQIIQESGLLVIRALFYKEGCASVENSRYNPLIMAVSPLTVLFVHKVEVTNQTFSTSQVTSCEILVFAVKSNSHLLDKVELKKPTGWFTGVGIFLLVLLVLGVAAAIFIACRKMGDPSEISDDKN